jgi:predicted RNA-binding Zn-ribbon protein involved in translation (DUF1610 family)
MPSHPWLQSLDTVAICPKCGAPSLHRSRSRTTIEKFKRKYSFKRQFRCHQCGWRGWYDETRLRYPTPDQPTEVPAIVSGSDIPAFDLNDEPLRPAPRVFPSMDRLDLDIPPSTREEPAEQAIVSPEEPETHPAVPQTTDSDEVRPPDFYRDDNPAPLSYDVPVQDYRRHKKRSGYDCPKCGSPSLFRSRHRSFLEMVRKNMSARRPYRCHKCGWRGWLKKI